MAASGATWPVKKVIARFAIWNFVARYVDKLGNELRPQLDGPRRRSLAEADRPALTLAGRAAAARIAEVRCGEIRRLLDGWEPDEHPAVLARRQRFGRICAKAPPAPAPAPA